MEGTTLSRNTELITAFDRYKAIDQIGQGGNGILFLVQSDEKEE
jgi:hypothetical protein